MASARFSPTRIGDDDVQHVGAGAAGARRIERVLPRHDAHGLQRQIREVDHAALDRPRRILAIRELVLAVVAAVVANEGRVEVLDRLGNRDRAEHQILIVAALPGVVDVELVDGHAGVLGQVARGRGGRALHLLVAVVDRQAAVVPAAGRVDGLGNEDGRRGRRHDHVQLARLVRLGLDREPDPELQALAIDGDERFGEPLERLLVVDLEVVVRAVGSRPHRQDRDLHQPADLDALEDLVERRAPQRRVGVARAAHPELRVRPRVDVAGGDRQAEFGEKPAARAIDRGRVEVAVHGRLEDALVDLDRRHARRLRAAALPFEVVPERRVVRVVAGRREAVAEVARRPVPDAHPDVHPVEELDRGVAPEVARSGRSKRHLVLRETCHGCLLQAAFRRGLPARGYVIIAVALV